MYSNTKNQTCKHKNAILYMRGSREGVCGGGGGGGSQIIGFLSKTGPDALLMARL